MNSFRYMIIVSLFIFFDFQIEIFSADASARGLKAYTPDQLSLSGREWQKFCLGETRKFYRHRYKFKGFELAGAFSENENVHSEMLQIGSLQMPFIELLENLEISSEIYEDDGFLIKGNAESVYLTISRTPVRIQKNFWGGVEKHKKDKEYEVSSLLFPSGFTIISQIREGLITTPEKISCLETSEHDDKRALLLIGIKGKDSAKFYDLTEIGLFGYIELREIGKSTSMSIRYEKDGSMYEIFLNLKVTDAICTLKEQIISRLNYGEPLKFESAPDELSYLVNRLNVQ